MSLCKSNCIGSPLSLPWWSKENLKACKIFLLSSHVKSMLPLHGEFTYKPLYWEWLEDVFVRCTDKLTTFHLFDTLYASLFLYNRCSNLIRVVCEYWCSKTNTLHTSKGQASLSIFNIYSFLRLSLSGRLYDEVVHNQRELTNKLPLSCTYLFTAYHKLMKSDQGNRIPHPGILSSIIDVIFDELGVAIGQRTETFFAAFLFCWLCIFIFPVRDAGCIRPDTFNVASFMALGPGYCLHTATLASVYKGLNKISRSSCPEVGGYFPAHFLYAWLAKNFDAYELAGEASSSPGMVKFSGLGQVKSFLLEEAR
ncbi:LOW QUALITY PROTEIN: hypothetical protein Cgig2_021587 [Carnegiea gigantea]|uniref:Aminotransferase-like plant mobile domain-containing protein n=1 Tax=Carnegiea gigantea TaxID=171969 RepID=A0A9Q1JHD1_9CARY|nr:LOW QUALITY PROTEIN: hypothetical protein Cgig2_021587 [Carnegiea gigantea]